MRLAYINTHHRSVFRLPLRVVSDRFAAERPSDEQHCREGSLARREHEGIHKSLTIALDFEKPKLVTLGDGRGRRKKKGNADRRQFISSLSRPDKTGISRFSFFVAFPLCTLCGSHFLSLICHRHRSPQEPSRRSNGFHFTQTKMRRGLIQASRSAVPTSASGVFASRAFPRTFIASRGFATGTPIGVALRLSQHRRF